MYCKICNTYCGFDENTDCGNKKCVIVKKFISKHGVNKLADILELTNHNIKIEKTKLNKLDSYINN